MVVLSGTIPAETERDVRLLSSLVYASICLDLRLNLSICLCLSIYLKIYTARLDSHVL